MPLTGTRVMVVEDSMKDLKQCMAVLQRMGAAHVDALTNVSAAKVKLEEAVEGNGEAPGLIVLDLNFPNESGFEVLRLWRGDARLKKIPMVVWTVMGETEKELCRFFGASVVAKYEGEAELEKTVKVAVAGQRRPAEDDQTGRVM